MFWFRQLWKIGKSNVIAKVFYIFFLFLGSVDSSVPGPMIVQKDVHPVKLISDENMHVHKETNFGGNILSKLIFFVVLVAIGAALCLSLASRGK